MSFHEKLRDSRKASGMTQRSVAQFLGISERAYQHYESGSREPNIKTLIRLSILLDISLDDLLCRDDYLKPREESSDEH